MRRVVVMEVMEMAVRMGIDIEQGREREGVCTYFRVLEEGGRKEKNKNNTVNKGVDKIHVHVRRNTTPGKKKQAVFFGGGGERVDRQRTECECVSESSWGRDE